MKCFIVKGCKSAGGLFRFPKCGQTLFGCVCIR